MENRYLDVIIVKTITYDGDNKPEQTPQRSPSKYKIEIMKQFQC